MNIRVLKTEKDYDDALERLDQIFEVPENTPEGDEAELLSLSLIHISEPTRPY